MENDFNIGMSDNLILPDNGIAAVNLRLLLSPVEFERVRAALLDGKRIMQTRLTRSKKPESRLCRGIDINNIELSLYKTEHCKPKSFYPVDLLANEVETLIYCLEHSAKGKSKDTQQLIEALNSYFYG